MKYSSILQNIMLYVMNEAEQGSDQRRGDSEQNIYLYCVPQKASTKRYLEKAEAEWELQLCYRNITKELKMDHNIEEEERYSQRATASNQEKMNCYNLHKNNNTGGVESVLSSELN